MKKLLLILYMLLYVPLSSQSQNDFYVTTYANPSMIMEHSTSTIFANVSGAEDEVSYIWSPADGLEDPYNWKTVAKPKTTTTYVVTATCGELVATASVTIKVVQVPKNVRATVDGDEVLLEWDEVEFAESYIVNREGKPHSTYVSHNSFIDKDLPDGTYCYTVMAVRDGANTPDSKEVCADVNTISLDDIMKDEMSIFPNPAKDVVNIKGKRLKSFSIYDITGQELLTDNVMSDEISVDVNELDAGIYILYVETENGAVIRKINVIK